jgi:hypothetical protein
MKQHSWEHVARARFMLRHSFPHLGCPSHPQIPTENFSYCAASVEQHSWEHVARASFTPHHSFPHLGRPSHPQIPTERIFLIVQQRWSSPAGSTWRGRTLRRVIHFPIWIALLVLFFLLKEFCLIVQQLWSSTAGSTWRERALCRVIISPPGASFASSNSN